jgi:autotransporter-associated beta strand protein
MSGSALWIEKYGAGTSVLSGSNTYENATRIYAGALLVNGTNTAGGSFTAAAGQRWAARG